MRITKERLKEMIRESLQDYVRQIDPAGAAGTASAAAIRKANDKEWHAKARAMRQQELEDWVDQALENPEGWIKKYPDEDDQGDLARMVKRVKDAIAQDAKHGKKAKEKFLARMARLIKDGDFDPPEGWPLPKRSVGSRGY